MAIAGIPNNFQVQQANFQVLVSWNLMPGATSYQVQRSIDGVNYTNLAAPAGNSYLDIAVTVGTQYFYQVASINVSGTSGYTIPQSIVPTPTSEMSLGEIRLKAKQRADMVNSGFITDPEWNSYINQSMYELYDLLVTTYDDYFLAPSASFVTNLGNAQNFYPIPDGIAQFTDQNNNAFIPPPLYKIRGVDLAINTSNNANVTVQKFNFLDRNNYVYPNTASTIYGVFNLQYRLMGNQIEFIPAPANNQKITIWYIPRLKELLADTDITTIGNSGWLEYVIIRSAILALTKQESPMADTLSAALLDLRKRIEGAADNRDAGLPDTITNVRQNGYWGGGSPFGYSGANGGY